jgi:thiol-disulfide isomerase/thioredoxin
MRFSLFLSLFLAVSSLLPTTISAADNLQIMFFGSSTCGECLKIKEELIYPLQKKHKEALDVIILDTDNDSALSILIKMEEEYKVKSTASQELFFPDTFLTGYDDIMKYGKMMIEARIGKNVGSFKQLTADSSELTNFLKNKAMDWGFLIGTILTGLADGINPCAIATMIFLISFMATQKRTRKQILLIGMTYTATVFVTYLAMGLGLKGVVDQIKGRYILYQIIRWGAFLAAVTVAFFSFKDAFVYKKTRKSENISLQLPKSVKLRIHKIISGNLSGTSLVIGSITTGFLVTILEAICTGQMYVPYIVAMTQRESLRLKGFLFLILYNFLFVLPLLIVMVLAYFGLKWNDLAKKTQKNMVFLKITLGLVMTALAFYLAIDLI